MQRRHLLTAAAALPLLACQRPAPELPGGFADTDTLAHGHALRDQLAQGHALPAPAATHHCAVVIAGGGMAGLAAARALRLAGEHDVALLELQAQPGGNSRAGALAGLPCPLGAHYLPLPGDSAWEVQDLLQELGLRQQVAGRWRYDERHLCHSPQERLFFQGHWHEGLLPVDGVGAATLAQYRQFAQQVRQLSAQAPFALPAARHWEQKQDRSQSQQFLLVHRQLHHLFYLRNNALLQLQSTQLQF